MTDTLRLELSGGKHHAIIDADQFEAEHAVEFRDGKVWTGRVCDRKWKALVKPHTTYAVCIWHIGKVQKELRLHRLLMDAKTGRIIDHKDGDGLNNRCSNLRDTDAKGNARNRKLPTHKRFIGVTTHKVSGKYEAYIRVDGKKIHLGLHADEEVAARIRDQAAIEHHGEFATLNFPLPTLSQPKEPQWKS